MEGRNILRGQLMYYRNCPYPGWLMAPQEADISRPVAYVRMPNGSCLHGTLEPFSPNHPSDIHGDRAFIVKENEDTITVFLSFDNHPLRIYMIPRLYIRMPNHNQALYSGFLKYVDGHLPNWLQ